MKKLDPHSFTIFQNQWVAISSDSAQVLAAAPTLKEIETKATKLKNEHIALTFITPPDKTSLLIFHGLYETYISPARTLRHPILRKRLFTFTFHKELLGSVNSIFFKALL